MKIILQKKFLEDVKKVYKNGGTDIEKISYDGEHLTFKSYAEINKFLGDKFFTNKNDFIYLTGYLTAKAGYSPTIIINNKIIK